MTPLRTHADPTLASMSSSDNTTTSYMKCGALADDSTLALCVVWCPNGLYTALKARVVNAKAVG